MVQLVHCYYRCYNIVVGQYVESGMAMMISGKKNIGNLRQWRQHCMHHINYHITSSVRC